MRPEDVPALLHELERDGYVELRLPALSLTRRGREARDAIEHETDRVYFAPWPYIDVAWVRGRLVELAANLARHK